MRPKAGFAFLIIAMVVALVATFNSAALAQEISPTIYSGPVTIGDNLAPDGLTLVARINDYESVGVTIKNGRYSFLIVSPPHSDYFIETVTFHIPELDIQAQETDIFRGNTAQFEKALTFFAVEGLVPGPTPTPGPLRAATPTPVPTQPVAQPPSPPVMYFGNVTVNGQPAPDGLVIVARIEDYQSESVTTNNGAYARLTVSPPSSSYQYKDTTFHIGAFGVQASETVLFLGGPAERPLDLTFPVLPEPTPTPLPTATRVPVPTATQVPVPTATQVPVPIPTPAPSPTATPTRVRPTPTTIRPATTPDINGDGLVNEKDLVLLSAAYATRDGDRSFDRRADLNNDGLVDYQDLAILGAQYER